MHKRRWLLVILPLTITAAPLNADWFQPSHSCSKPYKPYQFSSEWEYNNFVDEVEDYRNCISDFVDEQNEAAAAHQAAAEEAIDEWNRFVNYELD